MLTRHAFRGRAAAVLAAASIWTLTGCTGGPLPPAERPEVVWADGEPSGPLENDPWVQAVRASDLELRIAHATRDFSNTAIGDTTSSGPLFGLLGSVQASAKDGEWSFPPGPTPMIPVHVEEAADGKSASVYTCRAAGWTISADDPEIEDPLRGRFAELKLVLEGGHRKVDQSGTLDDLDGVAYILGKDVIAPFLDGREGSDCNLDDAKIGLFDPQPDVTIEYTPEDIKTTAASDDDA